LHILAKINKKNSIELIKLLMPFSKDSLTMRNEKGKLPYEEAIDSSIKELLKIVEPSQRL
jgi:hypothetical protein